MRTRIITIFSAFVLAGTVLFGTPAQAASKPVSISSVSTQGVGWTGQATHYALFKKKKKGVSVKSSTISVYSYAAKNTIAVNKTRVNLDQGKYKITAKVSYKYKKKSSSVSKSYVLNVKQGACATRQDVAGLVEDSLLTDGFNGESIASTKVKLRSSGKIDGSATYRGVLQRVVNDPGSTDQQRAEAQTDLDTLPQDKLNAKIFEIYDFKACYSPKRGDVTAFFRFDDAGNSSLFFAVTPDDFA